jgi:hypothetical protein
MNFRPFRHSIKYWKARIFKFAPVEHPYSQQEAEQLAAEIIEYGRMRQEHHGSHSVFLSSGEMAMRLRETSNTIVKALGMLRDQGRAEEIGSQGCWRVHFSVTTREHASECAVREVPTTDELGR